MSRFVSFSCDGNPANVKWVMEVSLGNGGVAGDDISQEIDHGEFVAIRGEPLH